MSYAAIILAAGSGTRMNLGYNKMLLRIKDQPLISLSIKPFLKDENCTELIIVINETDVEVISKLLEKEITNKQYKIVTGSYERQYSVYNGLQAVTKELVLVHDGARPFITNTLITELVNNAKEYGCAIPGVKVKDTIKVIEDETVKETLPREILVAVQTPQACLTDLLKSAHEKAKEEDYLGTDEASLIEKYTNAKVKVVLSSYENIKITTQEDLYYAEKLYDKYFRISEE